jgi:isoamylase
MKVAVRRLHAAGIEVILDVVYNHTAEGNELGPTLSFRGIDNANYYRLSPDNPRHYINDTGTGNTVNVSHPRVLQMVMDSLRYWVEEFHVDGFRFDLAVTLGREGSGGFDPGAGFFDAVRQDPVLSRVKLISEPWDPGPGGYQLGKHPPGWAEWNDRFRDGTRRFWRADDSTRSDFAARLAGSSELFDQRGRRPWASINYAACHDGFTLADTTSYAEKHNEANGEDNNDGQSENQSSNWGVEGPTDDIGIVEKRRSIQRAMLATVFTAQGTPMLLSGDEFGRTQGGNNNAYCQDNETSWLDWTRAESPESQALATFVARLAALRHRHSILRCARFLHGKDEPAPGVLDITWFDERGLTLSSDDWNNPQGRLLALRRAAKDDDGSVFVLTTFFNSTNEDHHFKLLEPHLPMRLLFDSADPERPESDVEGDVPVKAHSVVLTESMIRTSE